VVAEKLAAEAVEGADPGLAVGVDQALVEPSPDLLGGAFGEGQDQDLAAFGQAMPDQVGVELDQGLGLARAGTGEDSQGAVERFGGEETGFWVRGLPVGGGGLTDYPLSRCYPG
jgi:hypothetical protein